MARQPKGHKAESEHDRQRQLQREVRQRELQREARRREEVQPAIRRSVSSAGSTTGWNGNMPYWGGYPIWVPVWQFSYRYGIWVQVWYIDYL